MDRESASGVLRQVRNAEGISRAELSRRIGLSRPAVSAIVDGLLELGLLEELGKGESRGGRCPTVLSLKASGFMSLGMDIGLEREIRGVLCDGYGKVLAERSAENVGAGFGEIRDGVLRLALELSACAGSCGVRGLCLGVSGIVDTGRNEVLRSAGFELAERGLAGELTLALGIPVFLDNRARLAARAEMELGAARGHKDFLYVSTGRSIGCAICAEGRLFHGHGGMAGELRNFPVSRADDGTYMTLEQVAGEAGLIRAAGKADFRELLEGFRRDEEVCLEAVKRAAEATGRALGALREFMDSPAVVLGGRVKEFGEPYMRAFRDGMESVCKPSGLCLSWSGFGSLACPLGAAMNVAGKCLALELDVNNP